MPTTEGLLLKLQSSFQRKIMPLSTEKNQFAYVSHPETEQQAGLLASTSEVLLQNGLTKESIEAIKLRVEIAPNNPMAQGHLGVILLRSGRYEGAVDSFKKVIKLNPENDSTYKRLGDVLRRLGRYEEASNAYKKSIAINPKSPNSYYGLGNVLMDMGRHQEAIREYRTFISLANKDFDKDLISRANDKIQELQGKIK